MGVPPMRYDINSLRSAEHIAPQAYRIQPDISQIPSGIYIAASRKRLAKPGSAQKNMPFLDRSEKGMC